MHVFVMGACACLFIIEDMRYIVCYISLVVYGFFHIIGS